MNNHFRKTTLLSFIFLALTSGCTSGGYPPVNPPQAHPSTPPPITARPKIISYGDSLIAGYGIEGWDDSFASQLQKLVDAGGYNFQVLNNGVNGDTVETGYSRLAFTADFRNQKIIILELGANNISRRDDPQHIREYLRDIIAEMQLRKVDILLCGYRSPPEYGEVYAKEIDDMYAGLAAEFSLPFMPNFMAGVANDPELMQPDGIHPNPKGVSKIAGNVFSLLKPILEKHARSKP